MSMGDLGLMICKPYQNNHYVFVFVTGKHTMEAYGSTTEVVCRTVYKSK